MHKGKEVGEKRVEETKEAVAKKGWNGREGEGRRRRPG